MQFLERLFFSFIETDIIEDEVVFMRIFRFLHAGRCSLIRYIFTLGHAELEIQHITSHGCEIHKRKQLDCPTTIAHRHEGVLEVGDGL